jgi:hypothetical protein
MAIASLITQCVELADEEAVIVDGDTGNQSPARARVCT